MRIWIDLANSPHVPFFRALGLELQTRGHELELTARDFAQTMEMATGAGLDTTVIGKHGGRGLGGKATNLAGRTIALMRWASGRRFELALSHNSYSQITAARFLRVRTVTLMDYEHQPANHLAFRLASRVIVPAAFPADALQRFGASARRVRRYNGIKEDVYLSNFAPDLQFPAKLKTEFGIESDDLLVIARPPAGEALYHRFENELFDELLNHLGEVPRAKVLIVARNEAQRDAIRARHQVENFIFPEQALDGANLIAAADLVVSAGGTMNREAAALGVPAATIYAGSWGAIDEQLVREGRLIRISKRDDLLRVPLTKKGRRNPRQATRVRNEVADLIVNEW